MEISPIGQWYLAKRSAPNWPVDGDYVKRPITIRLNPRAHAVLIALADYSGETPTNLATEFLEMAISQARDAIPQDEYCGYGVEFEHNQRACLAQLEGIALKTFEAGAPRPVEQVAT